MITENNWLQSNIRDRLEDFDKDFTCTVTPYKFKQYTFNVSCSRAARHIGRKYPKIYLALSGGLDSSHVFKVLMKNHLDVKFTPVIVKIEDNASNALEIVRAIKLCSDYNIVPKIIRTTERECIAKYWNKIAKESKGVGIYSGPLYMVGEMAKEDGAVVISGEHIINTFHNYTSEMISSEYDFYIDFIDPNILIPFFMYSLEIVNATCKYAIDNNIKPTVLKNILYKTKEHTINNSWSPSNSKFINAIPWINTRKNVYHKYGSFLDFYNSLESWRT